VKRPASAFGAKPKSLCRATGKTGFPAAPNRSCTRRGPLSDVLRSVQRNPARGEITVVLGPGNAPARQSSGSLAGEIRKLMSERGIDERVALKAVARARGISRSEAYRQFMREKSTKT
jgi:16S rRNA C1402 (ribose-2'-O) methylase RsmI